MMKNVLMNIGDSWEKCNIEQEEKGLSGVFRTRKCPNEEHIRDLVDELITRENLATIIRVEGDYVFLRTFRELGKYETPPKCYTVEEIASLTTVENLCEENEFLIFPDYLDKNNIDVVTELMFRGANVIAFTNLFKFNLVDLLDENKMCMQERKDIVKRIKVYSLNED